MSGALQSPDTHITKVPEISQGMFHSSNAIKRQSLRASRNFTRGLTVRAPDSKINGEDTETAPPTEQAPTEDKPAETGEDTEMKDDVEGSAVAEPAEATEATEANGTPASSSKKQTNGKRKSGATVPEHKGKKLNKKKSMPKITHLDAKPGEFYFARLKSYPPWPSVVCDEQMLPTSLLTTRPVTTRQEDGTYKEAYADGGKRAHERTFPVMFLHTNEL